MITKAVPVRISTHPRTGHSGQNLHYAGALVRGEGKLNRSSIRGRESESAIFRKVPHSRQSCALVVPYSARDFEKSLDILAGACGW
jgi:hypothetical protein